MEFSDKPEKRLRFGCGFVFGLILGGLGAAIMFYDDGTTIIAAALVVALILGLASLQFGASFWRVMKHWIWWYH